MSVGIFRNYQDNHTTDKIDIKDFYKATNPTRTLKAQNVEDQKCYIDFSEVRGEDIISTLKDHIEWNQDDRTCNLFTGHIGCGKSTELLRLQVELEAAEDRLNKITEIFDTPATLDRLCQVSGGHVRDILKLLNPWIMRDKKFPLQSNTLEMIIRD